MLWLTIGVGLLAVYVLVLLIVSWVSLHPPRVPLFVSPGAMGAPQEDVLVPSRGLDLNGWWVPAEGATAVMVLVHGYVMNRAELSPVAYHLWRRGVSCLLIDLPAHGRSPGRKCGLGVYEQHDVAAAVQWVRNRYPHARIGVVGSSMGAAATALAQGNGHMRADLLVLDSCYGSLSGAALGWWRFLGGVKLAVLMAPSVLLAAPMAGFNPFAIDVAQILDRVAVPVLFFHGTRDDLALPSEAVRNYEQAAGPKKLVWLEGYGHSEGRWESPGLYYEELFDFLETHAFVTKNGGAPIAETEKPVM